MLSESHINTSLCFPKCYFTPRHKGFKVVCLAQSVFMWTACDFTNDAAISTLTAPSQCSVLHVQTGPFRQFMSYNWLLITKQGAVGCLEHRQAIQHKACSRMQILRAKGPVHHTEGQVFRLLNEPHGVCTFSWKASQGKQHKIHQLRSPTYIFCTLSWWSC